MKNTKGSKDSQSISDASGKAVSLPQKYPRKQSEGPAMDYQSTDLMFPKPFGKKKKRR